MTEEWKEVPGWPGYLVSDHGRMWGRRGRELDPTTNRKNGYRYVGLAKGDGSGGNTSFNVHRLVLEAFVGPRPDGMLCRHLDGDPSNNHLSNLSWGTPLENMADKVTHGRESHHHGGRAKLTPEQVAEIRATDFTPRGTQRAMAKRFGVTPTTIFNAYNGRLYRDA